MQQADPDLVRRAAGPAFGELAAGIDLAANPGEKLDVATHEPERVRELRDALRRWQAAHPLEMRGVGDLDPELVERLRALGYL